MCIFVRYTFGASINFPYLFLRSLNEVHRSSVVAHALINPIFILKILLFLGLDDFPADELVHIIAPIGATFLRQRAAHLRVGPTRPRGASSGVVPPLPLLQVLIRLRHLVLLLLMLMFLHRLLRMIQTFDVCWIMS